MDIKGKRIVLKPFSKKYHKELEILLVPEITRWIEPIALGKTKEILKWLITMKSTTRRYSYVIMRKREIIGMIWIERISKKNLSGDWGLFIGKKYQEEGYAKEASDLIINYGFAKLGLRKITAITNNHNKKAQRLAKSLGFTEIKRLKKDYQEKATDRWCDVLFYSLFKDDWKS
jgi:[ribosomal protein S5]-alanine N-acetyltransferase